MDDTATRPDDLTWIKRDTFEDAQWVRDAFDRDEPGFFKENLESMSTVAPSEHLLYWYSKFQDILESPQYFEHGAYASANDVNGQVLFSVVDVRPSADYPRGRTLIFGGGNLLYAGDARAWSEKYPWRWHGYSFFSWFKLPGKFWGTALLSMLVPLQKKINSIDALVQSNREFISLGQWLIPKQAKMREGVFSGIPGEHYTYIDSGGQKPEKVGNVPLPQELLAERAQLIHSIEAISATGVLDTQAVSPSGARAGVMLQNLQEQKLQSKSPTIKDFQAFLENIAQNVLIDYQLNLIAEDPILTARLKKAMRETSSLSIAAFTGASLRDHHNVTIDIESEIMFSPAGMRALGMEYMQYLPNLMNADPQEREAIRKIAGIDRFIKNAENQAVKKARRMVARIASGMLNFDVVMPGIDIPGPMAGVFQLEMMSDRFYDHEPEVQAKLAEMFDIYSQMHAEQQKAQEERMIRLQQAQQGAPAQGGGGKS